MNELISARKEELVDLCRRFHVRTLELFGSATRSDFDSDRSDLDFLVDFMPLEPGPHARAYFGLLIALEELFQRKVDLVETEAIRNPYFLAELKRSRRVLYAA